MGVAGLGYLMLDVADMEAWLKLVTNIFGMEVKPRPDKAVDLRIDHFHHRFTLYPASENRIRSIGWEFASTEDLLAQVDALRAHGLKVTELPQDVLDDRKVRMGFSFYEPHLQLNTELFVYPLAHNLAFQPTRGIAGYNTQGLGLGHVVFHAEDPKKAIAFYTEVMGFKISDFIAWDGIDATFMHCNPRHHTLAIMNCFGTIQPGTFNHLMLEALDFNDVGYAYDIVRDTGVPIFLDMGKHSNDHMQSFYLRTPSGFCIEYGFGGLHIGPDWEIRSYDQPMLFGHRMVG